MFDGNKRGRFNRVVDQFEDSKFFNVVLCIFLMFALMGMLVFMCQR